MKFFLMTLIALSSTVFANTNVNLEPQISGSCKDGKFKTLNYIINTKKVETAQTVEISFTTFHGDCLNKKFQIRPIAKFFELKVFKPRFNTPWSYTLSHVVDHINDKMVRVTLTVNKDIVFANYSKRQYSMVVYPSNNKRNNYKWNINLDYNKKSDETKVKIIK
jgi:hypothetical protein